MHKQPREKFGGHANTLSMLDMHVDGPRGQRKSTDTLIQSMDYADHNARTSTEELDTIRTWQDKILKTQNLPEYVGGARGRVDKSSRLRSHVNRSSKWTAALFVVR